MDIKLTKAEEEAKDFVLNLLLKGTQPNQPCDSNFQDEDFKLPLWYDEAKFKCGQKYFQNNRFGIMTSNLYGLFSLISEPMGAKVLDMTKKSSTAETARQRYSATSLHMLSWYQDELKPGSNSWNSLKKVRKMHQFASKAGEAKGFGNIHQTAISVTVFGFLGYALIRPHLLVIRSDNDEDREGFVHLWAVIGSMLGVKDEFNMCLHRLEVVEIICHILNRYLFIPLIQLENPTFVKLGTAFVDGMSKYIPFSSFKSRLFLARRLAGVPGYQYDVDLKKEFIIRQIFTSDELKSLENNFQKVSGHEYRKHMLFDNNLYLLDFKRIEELKKDESGSYSSTENIFGLYKKNPNDMNNNDPLNSETIEIEEKLKFFGLQHPSEILITKVEEDQMQMYQNDRNFKKLSLGDQLLVKINNRQLQNNKFKFFRSYHEALLSLNMYFMKKNTKISYS